MTRRWDALLSRVLYHWRWQHGMLLLAIFSVAAALVAALWFSIAGWQSLSVADKGIFTADDFMAMLGAYSVLFLMLNLAASLAYVTLLGGFVLWMGRAGYMPVLTFARAWRLVLLTGMVPLAVILVFGQILQLSFGLGVVMMLTHGLWLRTLDLPEA